MMKIINQSAALVSFDEEEGSSSDAEETNSQTDSTEDRWSNAGLRHLHIWRQKRHLQLHIWRHEAQPPHLETEVSCLLCLTIELDQWMVQGQMFHHAAVDVSQLWGELKGGELVEGSVVVGEGNVSAGSFSDVLLVLGPGERHWSRKETSHMTDERVLLSQFHAVFGVDHVTGRRI